MCPSGVRIRKGGGGGGVASFLIKNVLRELQMRRTDFAVCAFWTSEALAVRRCVGDYQRGVLPYKRAPWNYKRPGRALKSFGRFAAKFYVAKYW